MTDAISNVFSPCRTQFIAQSSRRRDRQVVCEDFKTVYKSACQKSGQEALDVFCSKWQKTYQKW